MIMTCTHCTATRTVTDADPSPGCEACGRGVNGDLLATVPPQRARAWPTCPVCCHLYADSAVLGPPTDPAGHRCDRTPSYLNGIRFGLRNGALDHRLAQLTEAQLVAWPLLRELRSERLGPL